MTDKKSSFVISTSVPNSTVCPSELWARGCAELNSLLNSGHGQKKKKLGIHDIAHIKESQTLFLNMNIRMRNFLVHKIYNSCYGYFEKLFQSKFYRKKWKNTKVMLCQYCINISLEINFWVESWLKSEMSALCR